MTGTTRTILMLVAAAVYRLIFVVVIVVLVLPSSVPTTTMALKPTTTPYVRYRARVAYHGGSFAGFQLQRAHKKESQRTVQGVLEMALQRSFGIVTTERCIKVSGASRTDTGVHARGQAVHFDAPAVLVNTTTSLSLQDVQRRLDLCLPDDLVVWDLQVAPLCSTVVVGGDDDLEKDDDEEDDNDDEEKEDSSTSQGLRPWSVVFHAKRKLYVYRISLAPVVDPLDQHHRWHVPFYRDVDVDQFNSTLQLFIGTHDFRAFAASDFVSSTTVKTIYSVNLVPENNNNNEVGKYRIEIMLKGALYRQVRNMVGAALDEARRPSKKKNQRRRQANVARLLATGAARDENPAKPAPSHGLTLEHVYFDDY
jgi:tRNA pseudouridine38-40 synthase